MQFQFNSDFISTKLVKQVDLYIKQYIDEFSCRVVETMNNEKDKKWNVEDILELWNTCSVQETNMKNKKKENKEQKNNEEEPEKKEKNYCIYVYEKGEKKGTRCESVSKKDRDYCSKHESKKDNKSRRCMFVKFDKNKNEIQCDKNTCRKSKEFCSRHLTAFEKKQKDIKKSDLIKHFKDIPSAINDENDEKIFNIIRSCHKKFGLKIVYRLEKIFPQIYKDISTQIDEYITNLKEDFKEDFIRFDKENEINLEKDTSDDDTNSNESNDSDSDEDD